MKTNFCQATIVKLIVSEESLESGAASYLCLL